MLLLFYYAYSTLGRQQCVVQVGSQIRLFSRLEALSNIDLCRYCYYTIHLDMQTGFVPFGDGIPLWKTVHSLPRTVRDLHKQEASGKRKNIENSLNFRYFFVKIT
jgi:hypothetical protein